MQPPDGRLRQHPVKSSPMWVHNFKKPGAPFFPLSRLTVSASRFSFLRQAALNAMQK
jgi:hypothetical protein